MGLGMFSICIQWHIVDNVFCSTFANVFLYINVTFLTFFRLYSVGQLVGLMPVLAAYHLIFVSIVCIVFRYW